MIKVTYILSLIFKSLEYEWIVRYIDKSRIELSFILLNPDSCELQAFLVENGIEVYHIPFHGKKSYPRSLISCYKILKKVKPDFVNCNLLDANMIGLTASYFAGVKNRLHTRHHSTFHHVYFPKGKLYDRYANYLSTQIIAVSSLVKKVLVEMEGVKESKVRIISHGFGLEDFSDVSIERVNKLNLKYNPQNRRPVIGVISRYIEWKGVQYIVPAFEMLLKDYPNAILIIANARQGQYATFISEQLKKLPENSFREVIFESDILAFYRMLDVFVHVPIDGHSEAFGRIYSECLASGIPMVCTISGIAHDIIVHRHNAIVVPYKDGTAIYEAIIELLGSPEINRRLSENAKLTAVKYADMSIQRELLENLYLG